MRIAYLINVHPAPSHTFIRREIAALRGLGVDPLLISIRQFEGEVPDPCDVVDKASTTFVLNQRLTVLFANCARLLLTRPLHTSKTFVRACRQYVRAGNPFSKPIGYFVEACFVHRLLARHHIQFLHVHMGSNAAAVAQIVRWLGGPDYSVTIHGPEEFDQPEHLCLESKLRDASFVVSVSQMRCDQLRQDDPSIRPKVYLVRCGVEADFQAKLRLRRDVPDNAQFINVGRLCARKNHRHLISAVDIVRRSHPDVQLDIVGDGDLLHDLHDQIRNLGLEDHVRLLGTLDSAAVGRCIAQARAMVVPSLSETLPCVIMEAFALHRPVICTPVGSCAELIHDAENGWLIADSSPKTIAEAMIRVLNTPVTRLSEMGAEGASVIRQDYTSERQSRQMLDLFRRYAEGDTRVPPSRSAKPMSTERVG